MADTEPKRLTLEAAMQAMDRATMSRGWDYRITIQVCNPGGLSAHQTIDATDMHAGFDWTAGQLIVVPSRPLTWLTPEQVADITDSVRKGQSWHAYQAHKRHAEEIKALKARIAELEAAGAGREGAER